MRGSSRLLLISSIFSVFSIKVAAVKTHIVYWNASNPLFKNGDYEINVRLGDRIIMFCPHVKNMEDDEGAYLIINKDSEMAHMNCVLENPRQLITCNTPDKLISSLTTVRRYRMNTLGIELEPGQTHYFLSTSQGTKPDHELKKKMEGMCKHDHMRLKVVVDDFDPATVIDTTRSIPTSSPSPPTPSRFSVSFNQNEGVKKPTHVPRRHTKTHEEVPILGKYSESDIPALYNYNTGSEESPDRLPSSGWDAVRMNADEMLDVRSAYNAPTYTDYIISEHSSSAKFSLIILSIILLLSLR